MKAKEHLQELAANWRPLLASLIGLGTGFSFATYMTSIMAPHLLEEFGWTRSEFAAVNSLSLVMVAVFPLIGRLADMIGERRTALIGVITLPITFMLLSRLTGDVRVYIAIFLAQSLFCITTTATVYSRAVVSHVKNARGLALAIVASGPAAVGAIALPLLNGFVEEHGWRAGYQLLAAFTGTAGAVALLMMPPRIIPKGGASPVRAAWSDYGRLLRTSAFWILIAALLLCNLPQVIVLSQLNLVLLENGVPTANTTAMLSALSLGMLAGRFACGVAIDRLPPQLVSAFGLGVPSLGLFLLASTLDAPAVLTAAVFSIGVAYGAEGDLVGYLVARIFGVRVFSSVMGLMTAAMATSSSAGALLLSYNIGDAGAFAPFLWLCGASVLIGSALFLLLGPAIAARSGVLDAPVGAENQTA